MGHLMALIQLAFKIYQIESLKKSEKDRRGDSMGTFRLGVIGLVLLLIIILANSLYVVTDRQTAILLRFGEIVDPKIESGLHFKVPILHTVR